MQRKRIVYFLAGVLTSALLAIILKAILFFLSVMEASYQALHP